MNKHLTKNQIGKYVLYSLTDAEREKHRQHLEECEQCRMLVEREQVFLGKLKNSIQTHVNENTTNISPKYTFDELLPALRWTKAQERSARFGTVFSTASGLAGIIIVILSLLNLGSHGVDTTLPVLACALMTVPAVATSRAQILRRKKITEGLLLAVLMAGIAVLGLYEIYLLQTVVQQIALAGLNDYWAAVSLGSFSVLIFSCVYIIAVIGNIDYQFTHLGQPRSFRMLHWTLLIEGFILLLPLLIH